ncbi:MAG: hypothetical protein APR53_09205 [Methanoculleus sp. SDB]|nr:MAG: hypothetical protein APR53_09205 [Methanoculleus sp. SDB]
MAMKTSSAKSGPAQDRFRVPATVRIGVTGQRTLADEEQVAAAIRQVLERLDQILRDTPHRYAAISSLTEGGDRLLSGEVLAWPGRGMASDAELRLFLPMKVDEYIAECSTHASREACRSLVDRASSVEVMVPEDTDRRGACEEVGHAIVRYCDVLVAIWDGKPARIPGGTADMVKYARMVGRTLFWIDLTTGKVMEERHGDGILESFEYLNSFNGETVGGGEITGLCRDIYGRFTEKARIFGLDPVVIRPLAETLLPHFSRTVLLTKRYERRYMRAGSLVYALAAAAVATVAIQTLFFPDFLELLWIEVAEMGTVLVLLIASRLGDWHRKWMDYRFLSERLRTALFLSLFCVRAETPDPAMKPMLSHTPNDWIEAAFTRILETRPQLYCELTPPFEELKNFIISAWIDDQISSYTTMSGWNRQRHEILSQAGNTLFTLTLVFAAMHAYGLDHIWAVGHGDTSSLLAVLTIIFPAVAAALGAIRIKREYLRNSERYAHMVRHLSIIGLQIKRVRTIGSLVEALEAADEVTLREQQDWRVVFRFRELETP